MSARRHGLAPPVPYWTRPDARPGAVASVTVPHPSQVRDWTRCSVTYGRGGGGGTSNTWRRHTPKISAPARSFPHPAQTGGACVTVLSGLSISRSVALGAPGCLPCGLPERVGEERFGAGFFTNGESDDGGVPLLEESRPSWALNAATKPSSSVTRASSIAIWASLAASSDTTSSRAASGPDSMIRTIVDHRPAQRPQLTQAEQLHTSGCVTIRTVGRGMITAAFGRAMAHYSCRAHWTQSSANSARHWHYATCWSGSIGPTTALDRVNQPC
jgi:hypothetical protein